MKILDPGTITFVPTDTGFLRLTLADGTVCEPVSCAPLFPLSKPGEYITVTVARDKETEEVGIIEHLDGLAPDQLAIVVKELSLKCFTPEVTDIRKISRKSGTHQIDAVTDRGDRSFRIRDLKDNLTIGESGLVMMTDIDKCRYQIRDYRLLPAKARAELERALL